MKFSINLPWPHKNLFPNAGKSSLYKASHTRKARGDANLMTKAATRGLTFSENSFQFGVSITRIYSPPNRNRRDKDGCDAATKAYLDGISDALGIDDSKFDLEKSQLVEPVKNGNMCFIIREVSPFSQDAIEDDGFVTITPMGEQG